MKHPFFVFIFIGFYLQTVQGQVFESVLSWRYVPVDKTFWAQIESEKKDKKWVDIVALAEKQLSKGKNELEKAEAQAVVSQACYELGYYYCAYDSALNVLKKYPGSMPAIASLFVIEKLIQNEWIVEDEVQRIINIGNFKEVPAELLPMVSFFVYRDNLIRSLNEWQTDSLKKIAEGSYWKARLDFYKGLSLVQMGQWQEAVKAFYDLEMAAEKYPVLSQSIRMQRARLLYGLGLYEDADLLYSGFVFKNRIYGKVLLERSWLKYFQKDYSVSLGMLETLKAPYFRTASHPEQYLLAMISYRDLCHYKAVGEVYKEFDRFFKPWLTHLKENKPLFENKALLSIVLVQAQNTRISNMIGTIREEKKNIKTAEFSSAFKNTLSRMYDVGEERWKDYASQTLNSDLKKASIELLDYVEQLKLLDYVSGLDQYRLKPQFEQRMYNASEAKSPQKDLLFWPINGEFWWDEFNTYRVLVSDQCGGGE